MWYSYDEPPRGCDGLVLGSGPGRHYTAGRYAAETYNLHDLGRTATRLRCRRYAAGLPVSAATRGAETGGRRLTKHNNNNNTTTTITMTFFY